MITRLADKNDIPKMRSLWRESFGDSDSFLDWYFSDAFFRSKASLTLFGEEVVSMAFARTMPLKLRGREITAAMLNGVCTRTEFRKRGLMHENVLLLENTCRKEGIPVMINTPSGKNHYHSLNHRYITSSEHRIFEPTGGKALSSLTSLSGKEDITLKIYSSFAKSFSAIIARKAENQRERFTDYASDGARLLSLKDAYAVLYETKEKFICPEAVYASGTAKEELFSLFAELGRPCEVKQYGKKPTAVAALLDIRLLPNLGLPYSVIITDNVIKENNGVFSLDGKEHAPAAKLSSGEFLQVLFGYKGLFDTDDIIIIDEEGAKALASSLPEEKCFMIEEY